MDGKTTVSPSRGYPSRQKRRDNNGDEGMDGEDVDEAVAARGYRQARDNCDDEGMDGEDVDEAMAARGYRSPQKHWRQYDVDDESKTRQRRFRPRYGDADDDGDVEENAEVHDDLMVESANV